MATFTIDIPQGKVREIIERHIDEIDNNQFENLYEDLPRTWRGECTQLLHSIDIYPENYLPYIPSCFDWDDTDTYDLVIPPHIKSIGDKAFADCTNLYKIKFGNVEIIGRKAFYNCTKLERIELPKTIQYIKANAFCMTELTWVYYNGTKEEWSRIDINPSAWDATNAHIVRCKDGTTNL